MLSFPGAGRGGGWDNNQVPILASFFFNFFPVFFNYLAVARCSCLLLGFFLFFISKYWKKYMLFRPNPFAGCQSAFSQNHSQNVNEVLLT